MQYMGEIELLTRYVRGVVAGPRIPLDAVDEQAVEVLRREPLHAWLLRIARAGCKVRGARGNDDLARAALRLDGAQIGEIGATVEAKAGKGGEALETKK